ncbi:MAG: lipopolysaccharide assembly protein LapB, partial [Pseudomonadota bacterium]
MLAREMQKKQGIKVAVDFIKLYLQKNPSVRGLKRLIELQMHNADMQMREQLNILNEITAKVLENKPVYRCIECGFESKTLHWLCPHCRQWSTQKPIHGLEGD